jgi:uncharacterized protein (TIGR02145 family)
MSYKQLSLRSIAMKNNTSKLFFLLCLSLYLIVPSTCKKLEKVMMVSTGEVSNILINSAEVSGEVIDIGNGAIQRGHCYANNPNVNIDGPKTELGAPTGPGGFTSTLTNLEAGTKYYVKAYMRNTNETVYGEEISFLTVSASVPTLTTTAINSITTTTATSGGNISSDGGASVTARGVCWNTSSDPTTSNIKTTDGTGTGSFTSNITGLTAGTTYYVRAYATNSTGTAYGNELSFTATNEIVGTITDIDGNVYNTVTIGTQVWMKENLKTTKYNDGTAIPLVIDNMAWYNLSTPGYCWYNNDAATYKATYGALYNWYTFNTEKLCPKGWHVPPDKEWETLVVYLGWDVSGGKLKEIGTIHWRYPNTGATNETGFTALPGGRRIYDGTFEDIENYGYWWSSTRDTPVSALYRFMGYDYSWVLQGRDDLEAGESIRCLKD